MNRTKTTSGLAGYVVLAAVAILLWNSPLGATPLSTYAVALGVLLTLGAIVLNTYRNARPSLTMGRLIHDRDVDRPIQERR